MTERTILMDTRNMSEEQADAVLAELASVDCQLAVLQAKHEKRIEAEKEKHAEASADLLKRQGKLAGKLMGYILAHPDDFVRPRSRRTAFGQYGYQKATRCDITNVEACLAELHARGLEGCIKVKESVNKDEVRSVLEAGLVLETASVESGERAYYQVSKALVTQAVKASAAAEGGA